MEPDMNSYISTLESSVIGYKILYLRLNPGLWVGGKGNFKDEG